MPAFQRPELQPQLASVATITASVGGRTESFNIYPGSLRFSGPYASFLFQSPPLQPLTETVLEVDFPRDATAYLEPSGIELSEDIVSVMHDGDREHHLATSKAATETDEDTGCVLQALPEEQYRIFSSAFPSVRIEWNDAIVEIETEGEVWLRRWTIFPKSENAERSEMKGLVSREET
ncbi:uncharacterized protein BDZ99DRAFT_528411 [Mytilinidion resinicola]|uniref:Uncharacterized protein n=1 Tax=Mytilinidion resinicola TaxID=574789 RepID=A0A6A6XYG7_9PEZI|nr:uncharacterized protein BDZ99DRAFT_528411 [Mytilinidion resinicola]KAF2801460.1 hypothetical protein BDZ99DRAFT_528411 [Mytilinidion resinicola]